MAAWMRVVELVNNLEIGGAERILVHLAVELKARGHAIEVVCLRGEGPTSRDSRQSVGGL